MITLSSVLTGNYLSEDTYNLFFVICDTLRKNLLCRFFLFLRVYFFRKVNYNENMRTDYFNPNVYNRIYGVMQYPNVLALRVALETGLRIDDVLKIRKTDLKGRTIRGEAEKTGKPFKKVISKDLADRLLAISGGEFIFEHRYRADKHRTRQTVWKDIKKAQKLLHIDGNIAPHSARKTYAVEKFRESGIEATKKELQHDRLGTTMIYCFSDILSKSGENQTNVFDYDLLSELIADKVVKKLGKIKETY